MWSFGGDVASAWPEYSSADWTACLFASESGWLELSSVEVVVGEPGLGPKLTQRKHRAPG